MSKRLIGSVGVGWREPVKMCGIIARHHGWVPSQVKAKWGGLRYYCTVKDDADPLIITDTHKEIFRIEELSLKICEGCGADKRDTFGPHCAVKKWLRCYDDFSIEESKDGF